MKIFLSREDRLPSVTMLQKRCVWITTFVEAYDPPLKGLHDDVNFESPRIGEVFYVVSKDTQRWKGGKGHVSRDVLIKGLQSPSDDTLILLTAMLQELGYNPQQVHKF